MDDIILFAALIVMLESFQKYFNNPIELFSDLCLTNILDICVRTEKTILLHLKV